MRVGGEAQKTTRRQLIANNRSTRHGGGMTSGEEVANIHGRLLKSILQTERVDNKHCVVVIEPFNGVPVDCIDARERVYDANKYVEKISGLTTNLCAPSIWLSTLHASFEVAPPRCLSRGNNCSSRGGRMPNSYLNREDRDSATRSVGVPIEPLNQRSSEYNNKARFVRHRRRYQHRWEERWAWCRRASCSG